MSILASELIRRYAVARNRGATNGGIMSSLPVPSGVLGASFADITEAERTAGITLREKQFWHVATLAGAPLALAELFLTATTPLASRVRLYAGTQRDAAGDLTGAERKYGIGTLASDIVATDTALTVGFEVGAGADSVVQAGDTVRIADATNYEFGTVDAVVWTDDQAAITLTAGVIRNYAAASPTYVSSCLTQASVAPSVETPIITGDVTFDHSAHPIIPDYIAAVEEIVTLTFLTSTAFGAVSDTQGSLGSGTQASDFAPVNPAYGRARWTLPAAGWTSTATAGDTVILSIHPASIPFWRELIIPAGSAAGSDGSGVGIYGQS